jgi:hypothetical protein
LIKFKTLAISVGIAALAGSAALADKPGDRGDTPGLGFGQGGNHQTSVGVPGPVAGVGLLPLAAVGLYVWLRRGRTRAPKRAD